MVYKQRSAMLAVIVWYTLVILCPLTGIGLLMLSLSPYSFLKPLLDHLATDGSFERFSFQLYQSIQLPCLVGGGMLLGVGVLLIWKAGRSQLTVATFLQFIQRMVARLCSDFPRLFSGITQSLPPIWERLLLLVIVAFALIARLLLIQRGIEYDESYTYMEFARHSFWQVISDYHVPNNHVFHTLLVQLSTRLFGNALWAIRLPTFTAGILIVLNVYLLGRRLYQPWVGLAAAGVIAAAPVMIIYSTSARGYTLITLFTLLLFILADSARKQKNLAIWFIMILITGLGFYTIPIMLYPFGVVFIWLVMAGLLNEIDENYGGLKGWLKYLVGFGFCSALLSIFFYLPIFKTNGILTVFNGQQVVKSLSLADFIGYLPDRIADVQGDWLSGILPAWLLWILLIGVVLSAFLHSRVGRSRAQMLLAILFFMLTALLLQRPLIQARVLLFLLPLLILSSLAGWAALISLIPWPANNHYLLQNAAMLAILSVTLWAGGRYLLPFWQAPQNTYFATADSAALVTQHLKATLRAEEVVVLDQTEDARYWYYFDYYGIPQTHIRDIKRHHFTQVLVISYTNANKTVEEVLERFGPDAGFLRMDTLRESFRLRTTIVYQIDPYQEIVDREFPVNK